MNSDDDEKWKAYEIRTEVRSDGTSVVSVPGFSVDRAALREHPGNAARLVPPYARSWFGLENVAPETTWADLEEAARHDMPVFSAEEEVTISECDLPPQVHPTYYYGAGFASMHEREVLPTDCGPDNLLIHRPSRRLTFVDTGNLYIRPLHPTFMATHFHELRACYSTPPASFDAFMTGYVHYAYAVLDTRFPGYTDTLLSRLGANFLGTPRPRRTYVDTDRVLALLGKRIDPCGTQGLFANVTPANDALELSELLAVLSALAMTGARLSSLIGVLRTVPVTGTPAGVEWLSELGARTLSTKLEAAGGKRYVVLLARVAEKVLGGFTDASGWSDSWESLPLNPVPGALRTTVEGEEHAHVVAAVDRICDVAHTVSMHLARVPTLKRQSIEYAQTMWTVIQSSLTRARANEIRLLRLQAYDAARYSVAANTERGSEFFLSEVTAEMSRWKTWSIAFAASMKQFAAGEIRCPAFSFAFRVHDGFLWVLPRLRAHMYLDNDYSQALGLQLLVDCGRRFLEMRSALRDATLLCFERNAPTPYMGECFVQKTPEGSQFHDPISDWCYAFLMFFIDPASRDRTEQSLWDDLKTFRGDFH